MSRSSIFVFKRYSFNRSARELKCVYSYEDGPEFHEIYTFNFDFVDYDEAVLDRALQLLFFMAGVSYYKVFVPDQIRVESGLLDRETADFLDKTYQRGLGEFFYVNNLDPRTPVNFLVNSDSLPELTVQSGTGKLVGIGGGKDSLVSVDILQRAETPFTTWSLNHRPQLGPLVEHIGSQHLWVERAWDKQLLDLKDNSEAYNGHVPISAIFACVGTVVAILSGQRDAIVSNESSASEPTLRYQGIAINHQYSKSLEFEQDFQAVLRHNFGDSVRYYSLLRPFSELHIAERFARIFDMYHDVFSSCNRAFTHDSHSLFWDGTCPKCAFVFLVLTPFIDRQKLEALFGGKNLLLDSELETTYKQLLGIEGDKPLECVGEVKESRAAMRLAQKTYPELLKYEFDLPADYDFRAWGTGAMPSDVLDVLRRFAG